MADFWLGTDMPGWLTTSPVPVMVSRRRLATYKRLPQAAHPWFLDSGGFTELSMHGQWTITPHDYITEVRRYAQHVGRLQWVSPQDWMCEPWIVAKTGHTVADHQRRTVDNYLELRTLAPDLPIIPVLQGWSQNDYARHVEQYANAGVDLRTLPLVGLGSVCRRQATSEIGDIVAMLHTAGLRLHGFGCKTRAIQRYGHLLASADSMAWSYGGRYIKPCPVRGVASCAHCLHYALQWRDNVVQHIGTLPAAPTLWEGAA